MSRTFADIAKRIGPAVVSIDTKSKVNQTAAKVMSENEGSDDIMDFFHRQMQQRPVYGVGSGFIVDKRGYVITNSHVIEDAERITVKLDSGEEFDATVVGSDGREETDLAILKINARRDLPFLKFGDSDKAEVGDWVLAIGSPFGLSKSVSAGIISQTRRETPNSSAFQRFIQTDAVINPGNSGGPLVNMDGEVIGVNSQIATGTGAYAGVGFALPSNESANVYAQIVKNGKVRRGYLGAHLDSVKTEFARVYGLSEAKGAIITEIRDKLSPASIAGLQVGDIVVEFNGQTIENARDMISKIAAVQPDQAVSLVYLRETGANLDRKTASIKLGERPSRNRVSSNDRLAPSVNDVKADQKPFGLTLNELTPALTAKYQLDGLKGLVVKEINPSSYIADVKNSLGGTALGEGDLIQRINRLTVTDLRTFNNIVSRLNAGDAVVLHIRAYNPQALPPAQLQIVQFTVR
ncbi:MAG: trypsin-like peptidase domain-containing protein [Pyrinomonadaceae bacterium]